MLCGNFKAAIYLETGFGYQVLFTIFIAVGAFMGAIAGQFRYTGCAETPGQVQLKRYQLTGFITGTHTSGNIGKLKSFLESRHVNIEDRDEVIKKCF